MNSPRALLIQPPVYDFALYDLFLQPFGLLRIGGWLERAGYRVTFLDALDAREGAQSRADGPGRGKIARVPATKPQILRHVPRRYSRYGIGSDEIRDRVQAARPDVVLITTGMTYWYPAIAEMGALLRSEAPGVPVIAGGTAATLMPEWTAQALGTGVVVAGGAETASPSLPQILRSFGLPRPEGPLPFQPSPALRRQSLRLRDAAVIRLHEGCRHRCSYCASGILSPRFLPGDPRAMMAFLAEAVDAGITTFAFYDDALLEDAATHLVPLLEWVIGEFGERKLSFHLPNALHVQRLTPELCDLMYRCGVREVRLGVESLDESFHRRYDRKLIGVRVDDAAALLTRAGFQPGEVAAYVLAGLPDQPAGEVMRTVEGLFKLGIAPHVAEYSPVPGTQLFEEACAVSRYPLRDEPLCHNNTIFPTEHDGFTSDDLWNVKRAAREYRGRL